MGVVVELPASCVAFPCTSSVNFVFEPTPELSWVTRSHASYVQLCVQVAEEQAVDVSGPLRKDVSEACTDQDLTPVLDMNTLTATDLANNLVGAGVSVSNATFSGDAIAGGTFTGGAAPIGFDEGVILSSGDVADVTGPNVSDATFVDNTSGGDADLSALSGFTTFDAAVLEFDFVPNADTIYFRYVFASEEYNEYVNSQFNDVFAFFVNGTNCATVGDPPVPVSINTINGGNPFGSNATNSALYRNNDLSDGGGAIDTEMDGLTVVLTCEASVNPNVTNHIKLAIADASDSGLDSNVFLEAGSFSTTPPDGEFSCGEVRGDGRLAGQDKTRFVFYNLKSDGETVTGEVSFTDQATNPRTRFESTSITTFEIDGNTVTLGGQGVLLPSGAPVEWKVQGVDGSPDTFAISLSNGYTNSGAVGSGRGVNIKPCDEPVT